MADTVRHLEKIHVCKGGTQLTFLLAQEVQERKPRKSVAFSEGTTIVDENGEVTHQSDSHDGSKDTAQSHSAAPADEDDDEDLAEKLKSMKKKKKVKKVEEGEAAPEGGDEAAADGGLDLSAMKKKKKKSSKPKEGGEDDFAARLAELEIEGKEGEEGTAAPAEKKPADKGDMEKGTGIWQHNETVPIEYEDLLSRFFALLAQKNPDHASSGSKSYKIPPPQCLREGNKKTIFANIAEICKRMKRTDEHVTSYLFAELGTSGSVDGSRRLVIKGRFQQKQIENVLRRYISKSRSPTYYLEHLLTISQWNMSLARLADRQTLSSTRERTDCTSSPVTLVVLDDLLLLSRLVSPHRSERDADSRVRCASYGRLVHLFNRNLGASFMFWAGHVAWGGVQAQ